MKKTFESVLPAFGVLMILLAGGCAPAPTSIVVDSTEHAELLDPTQVEELFTIPTPTEERIVEERLTLVEAEERAGFDVREPAWLPAGVSFDFATYRPEPSPGVTLEFKLVHEQYGDMGRFFVIDQAPAAEAPADALSCGGTAQDCELLDIGGMPVVYRWDDTLTSAWTGTEGFTWYADGFLFRLSRVAGEPGRSYRDELVKVVESMK